MMTQPSAQSCLTDADRALLHAVTGWHLADAEHITPTRDSAGRPVLIPVLAWVLADARRQGKIREEVTPGFFEIAVHAVNRTHSSSLRLTERQIGSGRRHLHSRFVASQRAPAGGGVIICDRAAAAAP